MSLIFSHVDVFCDQLPKRSIENMESTWFIWTDKTKNGVIHVSGDRAYKLTYYLKKKYSYKRVIVKNWKYNALISGHPRGLTPGTYGGVMRDLLTFVANFWPRTGALDCFCTSEEKYKGNTRGKTNWICNTTTIVKMKDPYRGDWVHLYIALYNALYS